MNQQTTSYEQLLAKRLEMWKSIAVVFLLLAFTVQQVGVWIDPAFLSITLLLYATTYVSSIAAVSGGIRGKVHNFVFGLGLIGSVFFTISSSLSFETTRNEIEQTCLQLRTKLIEGPDSTAADTYQALKCPVYFSPPWTNWWIQHD